MSQYRISDQARADVSELWDYIARQSVRAADRLVDAIFDKYKILASFPELGTSYEQYRPGLRGFAFGNFVIFYRASEDGIEVARVVRGARDLPSLFPPNAN